MISPVSAVIVTLIMMWCTLGYGYYLYMINPINRALTKRKFIRVFILFVLLGPFVWVRKLCSFVVISIHMLCVFLIQEDHQDG